MQCEYWNAGNAEIATRCLRKYSEDAHSWAESENAAENVEMLNELLKIS